MSNNTISAVKIYQFTCSICGTISNTNSVVGRGVCAICENNYNPLTTSNTITINDSYTDTYLNTKSTIEQILNINKLNNKGKCSKCKEEKQLILSYKVIKIERKLCEECALSVVDKIFGIEDRNVKLERTLYGN